MTFARGLLAVILTVKLPIMTIIKYVTNQLLNVCKPYGYVTAICHSFVLITRYFFNCSVLISKEISICRQI